MNSAEKGLAYEARLLKSLKQMFPKAKIQGKIRGRLRSGGMDLKGDVLFGDALIQCKSCGKDLRVKQEELLKARRDAILHGLLPVVAVELDSGRQYWIVDDGVMLTLLESFVEEADDGTAEDGR